MRLRVSKGGQVSLPAEIRRRWATDSLVIEDLGDRVVLPTHPVRPRRGGPRGPAVAPNRRDGPGAGQTRGATGGIPQRPRVTLLDATALVAFLSGERAASAVGSILRAGTSAVTAVNLAESLEVLVRLRRHDPDVVDGKVVPLRATVLEVVPVGEAQARRAAAIRSAHYPRRDAPLSMAD